MKLYLEDISKGLDQSSGAKETPDEEQAIEAYDNSFKRRPSGPGAGEAVDTQDEGGVKDDEEDEVTKAADEVFSQYDAMFKRLAGRDEAAEMLKSLSSDLIAKHRARQPDPLEEEFLLSKGFSLRDIQKPSFRVNSRIRSEFNTWLCNRLVLDTKDILGRHT